jgi:pantoate kinase
MAATASCPAYLTGLFLIGDKDAVGAGFSIDKSLTTTVSERKSGRTTITLNGQEGALPVSKAVLRRYTEKGCRMGLLEISHATEIPVGFGLGMSAAGALSLSLSLNELLGAGLSREECIKIAHDSDVECGTGLSGVDAEAIGGMLARRSPSEAPVRLPFEEKEIEIAFYTPIKTSSVIKSPDWKKRVNAAGKEALDSLFGNKGWEGLVMASRQFSQKSGLAEWCTSEMESNPRASMAMLGHTLFSDIQMFLPRKPFMLLKAKTAQDGAKIL